MTEGVEIVGGSEYPADASVKLNGPPGTGKTTQLLERLTSLLDQGYTPNDVVFVTYRKEMASEFLRRLHERGYIDQDEAEEPWEHDTRHFGTLHGVCNRLVPDAEVVEDKHRREFMYEQYHAQYDGKGDGWADRHRKDNPVGGLLFDAYDWAVENKQDSFVHAPQRMEIQDKSISPPSFEEFESAWSDYKQDGGEDGEQLRDFAGMLRTVDQGDHRPPGSILLVDEYHDMTPIMASICEGWMESFDTTVVVGDPHQTVYSYKGASPKFFTDLDLPEVVLDRTYRIPSNVWEYARKVIKEDPPEIEPDSQGGTVRAVNGTPPRVVEVSGDSSVMFLARTQYQLYDIAESLKQEGIIFRSQDGIGGWNHSNRLLNLYNALQKVRGVKPAKHVNPNTGQTGMKRYQEEDVAKSVRLPQNVSLDASEASKLVRFTPAGYFSETKKSLRANIQARSRVPGKTLAEWVEPEFWGDMTRGSDSVDNLLTYKAKDSLRAALNHHDRPYPSIEAANVPDVLTIHAAKGKEADVVALYDGIPAAVQENIRNGAAESRAESRVWYVACTRAAEELMVFRGEYDNYRPYLPSTAGQGNS